MATTANGFPENGTGIPPGDYPVYRSDPGSDDNGGGIPVVEPENISATASASSGKRGRGRPRGSTARAASSKPEKERAGNLTNLLYSLHMMAARIAKIPELEIEEAEAARLNSAIQKVQKEFGVPILSPKAEAITEMAFTLGEVYVTRAIAIAHRKSEEAKNKGPKVVEGSFATAVK